MVLGLQLYRAEKGRRGKGGVDITVFTFLGTSVPSTQVQDKPTLQTRETKYLVWKAESRSPSFFLPRESKDSRGLPLNPEGLIHHLPTTVLEVNASLLRREAWGRERVQ